MNNRRSFLATLGIGSVALTQGQAPSPATSAPPPASGDTTLDVFQAAYKGDAVRVNALAKINPAIARLRSADGRTPLHYAVEGGQAAMIFVLTTLGADLSAGPESPLVTAVAYRDHAVASDMAQNLLMNASDPNAKRADGRTALDLAAERGYKDIVELLVHRGAKGSDVQVERVYFGKRYSFDAAGRPYEPQNLDGLPQDFINEVTVLSHRDVDRVMHLTKLAPALAHARATWDESPIEAASHMGLVTLAQFMADRGAAVSTCTATLLGLRDRVEALVKSDPACLRERGAHDIALLAYTAYGEQRVEIAEFLLRSGANVSASALGVSTLHIAAGKGYVELAEVLLAHGANVNAPAKNGSTPAAVAMKAKKDKMAEFLKSRGGRA
jgi:ankyrin repeat protein